VLTPLADAFDFLVDHRIFGADRSVSPHLRALRIRSVDAAGCIPVVVDRPEPALPADPDEFAVPKLFVPGAAGTLAELPAPLGSLPELLSPSALAGPLGTPLTPAVPAPAEPAFGDPTALPMPAEGPLAAPPADPPPAEPPADPPPPLWATALIGASKSATTIG
jgi:hypothetical protein